MLILQIRYTERRFRGHIMPESFGNTEHILPRGWVCDCCNNYFARKVEKPFLDSFFATSTRSIMGVPNKRERILPTMAFHAQSRSVVELARSEKGWAVSVAPGEDEGRWVNSLLTSKSGTLYVPVPPDVPEASVETARFIGKVAIEMLAALGSEEEWNAELVDQAALDNLRTYVRRGTPTITWPVGIRRIYDREHRFSDQISDNFEVLHEWMILPTAGGEYYGVVAIFGVEFVINLGGPELDGWTAWLAKNKMRSPIFDATPRDGRGA